eukprot:3228354-Rhodomonas_salina.1
MLVWVVLLLGHAASVSGALCGAITCSADTVCVQQTGPAIVTMVPALVQGVHQIDLHQGYVYGDGITTVASFEGYQNSGQVSVLGFTPAKFPASIELSVSFTAYLYNVVDVYNMFFFRVGRIIWGVLFDGLQLGLQHVGNAAAMQERCQVFSGWIELASTDSVFNVELVEPLQVRLVDVP